MKVTINPGRAVGRVSAPPSKSFAHRMIICAALAEGRSCVRGVSQSEDMLATLDCISALGAEYSVDGDTVYIDGGIRHSDKTKIYPCRESGSTLRFFIPLAMLDGGKACFTGSERLIERGVGIYEQALKSVSFNKTSDEIMLDGRLSEGYYSVRGLRSKF